MTLNNKRIIIMGRTLLAYLLLLSPFCWVASSAAAEPAALNPTFMYFTQGQTPGAWQWVLSDPDNWWQPLEANEGRSGAGKVSLSSAASEQFPDAVKVKWGRSDTEGAVAISGQTINLAKFEQAAELVIALKVESRVPRSVKVKMSCAEDCESAVDIADNLKALPRGKWVALPLALDCFAASGLDLSQVTSPFSIATNGALELHIADISVGSMAAGDEGCVPNS
jgi:beta-glucosidase